MIKNDTEHSIELVVFNSALMTDDELELCPIDITVTIPILIIRIVIK